MIYLSPIFGMLYNLKTGRFHPIFFTEATLPGPPNDDTPLRLKSRAHHTPGFDTREEAIAKTETDEARLEIPGVEFDWSNDIPWNGEDLPVHVAFLTKSANGSRITFL